MNKQVILVTGASSGFGLMTAQCLAQAGHTVYASMRATAARNAPQVAAIAAWAADQKVDLRTVELDVQSDASVSSGVAAVLIEAGRLDTIVHNAGHMVFGPAEAFTAEQYMQQYDVNVLGAQRARWGIATTIMVPGAFTKGTNHFAHAGTPADKACVAEYEAGPYAGVADQALKGLASLEPADADPVEVARQIVRVVNTPLGKRPFRVHIDPSQDGAEVVNGVADRVRREMYRDIGLQDLLSPRITG